MDGKILKNRKTIKKVSIKINFRRNGLTYKDKVLISSKRFLKTEGNCGAEKLINNQNEKVILVKKFKFLKSFATKRQINCKFRYRIKKITKKVYIKNT